MPRDLPGWLPLGDAAEQYGVEYERLRRMVKAGIFTRGRFTSDKEQAPIYLRVDELDAWKRGGVDAVREVRATPKKDESVHTHDLGGEGG